MAEDTGDGLTPATSDNSVNQPLKANDATPSIEEPSPPFFYEANEKDLRELVSGANTLESSGLFMPEVINNIRIVTFDSNYLYVITKGTHGSNDKFQVEEISTPDSKFRTYKISHAGNIGRNPADYKGGYGMMLCDEVESTAVEAQKFPYKGHILDNTQPESVLVTVQIPPPGPYKKIHQGQYDVLCDLLFHEAGHKQHERLIGWNPGSLDYFFQVMRKWHYF